MFSSFLADVEIGSVRETTKEVKKERKRRNSEEVWETGDSIAMHHYNQTKYSPKVDRSRWGTPYT